LQSSSWDFSASFIPEMGFISGGPDATPISFQRQPDGRDEERPDSTG
jgi:hypothetical protein